MQEFLWDGWDLQPSTLDCLRSKLRHSWFPFWYPNAVVVRGWGRRNTLGQWYLMPAEEYFLSHWWLYPYIWLSDADRGVRLQGTFLPCPWIKIAYSSVIWMWKTGHKAFWCVFVRIPKGRIFSVCSGQRCTCSLNDMQIGFAPCTFLPEWSWQFLVPLPFPSELGSIRRSLSAFGSRADFSRLNLESCNCVMLQVFKYG